MNLDTYNESIGFLKSIQLFHLKYAWDRNMYMRNFLSSPSFGKIFYASDFSEALLWKRLLSSSFKEADDWFKMDYENYFSPLDSDVDKCKIWFAAQAVHKIIPLYNYSIPQAVFGTFPMRHVNAHCIPSPYGGYIIAFNKGTFDFIENMALVFGSCFEKIQRKDKAGNLERVHSYPVEKKDIEENTYANKLFLDTISSYLLDKPIEKINLLNVDQDLLTWIRDYAGASYIFVVAHEYAHIICGHKSFPGEEDDFDQCTIRHRFFPTGETNTELIPPSWNREYEADEIAFKITLSYLYQTHDYFTSFFGIQFIFSVMQICDYVEGRQDFADYIKGNQTIIGKTYWGKSHSIFWDRLNNLRQFVQKILPAESEKLFAEAKLFFKAFEYLCEVNHDALQTLKSAVSDYRRELLKE